MQAPREHSEGIENIDGFEAVREAVLPAVLARAPFDGWTGAALDAGAREAGVAPASLKAAFPKGVRDVLRYWAQATDAAMLDAMAAPGFSDLRIREKVAFAVRARLEILRPHKEAARRAAALTALPPYAMLGAEFAWRAADAIWRGLGDQSADFNFYSKRGVLTGVWTSTFARWLADDSEDEAATHGFLDARIENVMQFEKAKARVRELGLDPVKPIELLARLRYPAGR